MSSLNTKSSACSGIDSAVAVISLQPNTLIKVNTELNNRHARRLTVDDTAARTATVVADAGIDYPSQNNPAPTRSILYSCCCCSHAAAAAAHWLHEMQPVMQPKNMDSRAKQIALAKYSVYERYFR